MRNYNLQTPQKPNHNPKSISDHAKKNQKTFKKNLNPALSAVSEDASVIEFESPKDLNLIDFTSFSENSEHNLIDDLSEDLTTSSSVEASPEREAAVSSVITPLSSTITFDDHEKSAALGCSEAENVNLSYLEAELVVKHLKEARLQLFNARTMNLQYKRLLDALINVIIKEFYEMPQEEAEGYNETIPGKAYLASISILLLVLAALVVIICFSRHTFNGPTPT